jgi:hypothetical protein
MTWDSDWVRVTATVLKEEKVKAHAVKFLREAYRAEDRAGETPCGLSRAWLCL